MVIFIIVLSTKPVAIAKGDKKSGLFTYEIKGNGNAIITGFDWKSNGSSDIYIPRQVDGYNVSEIGTYAFSSKEMKKTDTIGHPVVVIIPDTVTMIGDFAFWGSEITSINIPSSVQYIGSGALANCHNINQFTVDSSNPIFTTIDGVLYDKTSKELIAVPYARYNNPENTFTIPEGIKSIGDYAFYGFKLKGAYGGVSIPLSLVSIGNHAFENAIFSSSSIFDVTTPTFLFRNVTSVGDYAFANVQLKGSWDFGKLETIGDYAFSNVECYCDDSEFTLPSTVKMIGKGSFINYMQKNGNNGNSGNKNVRLFDLSSTKITEIPDYAFSNFQFNLDSSRKPSREIKLPDTISSIGAYAFGKIGTQEFTDKFSFHGIIIALPRNVRMIKEHAFDNASVIITFNNGLKIIEDGAFYKACLFSDSTTLNLPEGIESLGKSSFYAYNLDSLYIPDSVKVIGDNICDRSKTKLIVEPNSYGALYASENGYAVVNSGNEDTSWLND